MGAILANVVMTELVILVAYVISLPVFGANYQFVLSVLFLLAVLFPLAFYHHSWSLWLGFDYFIEGLPQARDRRR